MTQCLVMSCLQLPQILCILYMYCVLKVLVQLGTSSDFTHDPSQWACNLETLLLHSYHRLLCSVESVIQ